MMAGSNDLLARYHSAAMMDDVIRDRELDWFSVFMPCAEVLSCFYLRLL
jgi:hypothetical protein